MAVPGLKVVAPSTPQDVIALLAAAVRDPDPVIFFESKSLYSTKGEVADGEVVGELGQARVVRDGPDATILALASMVPRAVAAAAQLEEQHGIRCSVVDVRSLVPLDTRTILGEVARDRRALHRRGESAAVRLGSGDRLDRRRGVLRLADRSCRPDHHPAHPAARGRQPGRPPVLPSVAPITATIRESLEKA